MADEKVTDMVEETAPASTDLLEVVVDPSGSPDNKKATIGNVVLAGMVNIGARAYNSGNVTIGTASWTALTFDSERWDTDTIHSTVANTGRLTATTAGMYLISATITWTANATGNRGIRLMLNGATQIATLRFTTIDGANANQTVTTVYQLSATEYVTVEVYQDSGGDLAVVAAGNNSPEFMMQKIG